MIVLICMTSAVCHRAIYSPTRNTTKLCPMQLHRLLSLMLRPCNRSNSQFTAVPGICNLMGTARMISCNTSPIAPEKKRNSFIVVLVVDEIGRYNALLTAAEDIDVLFPICNSSPNACPDAWLILTIRSREQLLPNALLRLLVSSALLFRSQPAQRIHELFIRLLQLSSTGFVVPSQLFLPPAILQLNSTATFAGFPHYHGPRPRYLFVSIRLGVVVLRIVPRREIVNELGDAVEIAE